MGDKDLIEICTAALAEDDEDYSDINFVEGEFNHGITNIIFYKWCNELSEWRRDVCIDRVADETGVIKIDLQKSSSNENFNLLEPIMCTNEKHKECEETLGDIYTSHTMEKRYVEFIKDSKKVYILVRDLDFLNKETVKEEKSKIIKMGKDCKIIFERKENYSSEVRSLISELQKAGVELKTYPENDEKNIRNIKGQFKMNVTGNYECLVIGNQGYGENEDKFKLIDMDNRFLSNALWKMVKGFFDNDVEVKDVILGGEE